MPTRRLYLMRDYDSSSLWEDEPTHGMVPLDGLPLDQVTKVALEDWSPSVGHDDAEDELTAADQEALRTEGRRLWHQVRDQLGPEYQVGYATWVPAPSDEDVHELRKIIVWHPEDLDDSAIQL